ncbi:PREDICTED: uncharacterized protein LOC105368452 [Ceratosolen solmsi marchali]|uniref:Uncharacterized protein LOC105368452 n=1 Tax=Ceratosolen solmsi marchali TaxID=326594 RepID=A0AAJ7E2T6_9HYME|nr:PREDICTED: uncharacterized protein LOC105368452 [Ceratosolen solmsi marchali]
MNLRINILGSCRETLNIILQKQQEILNYLKHGQSFMQQERKLDLLPSMPFNDINDFLDFDESLTHENVQDQFIIKLKKLLVSTEQKSVSNIMSSIMTNELCRIISWIGIKNTIAFGTTNMVSLIIDLIQEHHHLNIDNGKARIAEWLRRCGDRIGNEIRKNRKRVQQGYST